MRWSWKLGTVAGIGVYIHATFTLLLAWVVLREWTRTHSPAATAQSLAFVLLLFACVVLHEFGHALTAKRFGILTRDITLLPIGGVARLERMPDDPRQELLVAIAGPLVNVVIAAVLYLGLQATGNVPSFEQLGSGQAPLLGQLMLVNVSLFLFNLLPAFPMDGGRVLRALLAIRMEYTRATQIAASIGQAVAFGLGFFGFFYNPFLMFIALFVWIGAEQEASMVQMKSALGGIPVRSAMLTEFHTLSPADSLERVVELSLASSQRDFPVVEDGKVRGIVTQDRLIGALSRDESSTVEEAMDRSFQTAVSSEMLESGLRRLQECECRVLPVLERGELVGLLTADNVGEFLMVQAARSGNGSFRRLNRPA
jgi:Zn-dependent protease/predicted transcriptional regulator